MGDCSASDQSTTAMLPVAAILWTMSVRFRVGDLWPQGSSGLSVGMKLTTEDVFAP